MLIESIVIFIILLGVFCVFLPTKSRYAVTVVPLLIPVGTNILAYLFSESISKLLPFDKMATFTIINISATVVSSVLIGLVSTRFKQRANKVSYLVMTIFFNIALLVIFLYNYSLKV